MQGIQPVFISTVFIFLSTVLSIGLAARAETRSPEVAPSGQPPTTLKKVVINEAVRTLLYLPLYHAIEKTIFVTRGFR